MKTKILALFTVLVIAAAALHAAEAQAAPFTPELEADYTAALEYWGVTSPPQCATVNREVLPMDPWATPGVTALGRATQPAPGESGLACNLYMIGDPPVSGCEAVMVERHEVGHLLGKGHSADPEDIMAPATDFAKWCSEPPSATVIQPGATGQPAPEGTAQQEEQGEAFSADWRWSAWHYWRIERARCHRRSGCLPRVRHEAERIRREYPPLPY